MIKRGIAITTFAAKWVVAVEEQAGFVKNGLRQQGLKK